MAVYQSLSLTQVGQNYEEKTSQVRILWQSQQTGTSYNMVQHTAQYIVSVNGETVSRVETQYVLPSQSTAVIVDTTITVPHNHKGEAEITVSTWMNTHISAGVVELNKTLVLENIPRASTLLASDGVIGGIAKIAVSKKRSSYGHSILCHFGNFRAYVTANGSLQDEEEIFLQDSVDLQLPEIFYEKIHNAKSGLCTLQLQTYDGSEPVGSVQETVFTVTTDEAVCRPYVFGTVVDGNAATRSLTGDENTLVRFMSDGVCRIYYRGEKGAFIVQRQVGQQVMQKDELTISGIEQEQVVFSVTDTRGYRAQYTHSCNLIPYVKLSAEAVAQRENAGNQAMVYISGDCFSGSFGAADNTLTVEVTVDGRAPIVAQTTVSENRYYAFAELEDMDYTRIYGITVRVKDRLMEAERRVTLKKAVPVFDWGEEDFAFHVPVQMDSPLSLESGGTGAATGEAAAENLGLIQPMEYYKEYTTLQRFLGQTVYTKLIDCGVMPNDAVKTVAHNANAQRILRCCGSTSLGMTLPYGGKHTDRAELFCDLEKVYIDTESDFSAQTAAVQIWYIK